MKKILSLILVLAMIFSLCACSTPSEEETGGETSTGENTPVTAEKEFTMGSSAGNRYHSDFLGMSIELPDGWDLYSDAEILQINNITKDYYDAEALELLKELDLVYDMYALETGEGSSVTVILEKASALQMLTLDVKEVIESQFDTLISTCEGVGYSDIEIAYKKITVDGVELDGYELTAYFIDMEFCMVGISMKRGNYLASITVGAFSKDKVYDILEGFEIE